jgi:hypothetical protein
MSQPLPGTQTTFLTLSGIEVPPFSARGLQQTLEPLDQSSNIMRTWNGALRDLTLPAFRKYRSTISGDDQNPPACDGVWQGQIVTVGCIVHLSYKNGTGGAPHRPAVAGSSYVQGAFTFYRPELVMMVMSFEQEEDEWEASVSWSLELEEV